MHDAGAVADFDIIIQLRFGRNTGPGVLHLFVNTVVGLSVIYVYAIDFMRYLLTGASS